MTTVRFNLDHLAVAALEFEEADDDEVPNPANGNNPLPPNHANNVANLPPPPNGPPQGPLAATTAGNHTLEEGQEAALTYDILLGPNSTLTNQDRLDQIADQPHPFALLIFRNPDSTPAILHSIKRFHAPIGTNHPLHGAILGFIGDALQWGTTPQLIHIPNTAFHPAVEYQMAGKPTLLAANANENTITAVATDPTHHTGTMINIPPTLIPFFLQHAHLRPLPLWRAFNTWKNQNQDTINNHYEYIETFLRIATIRTNNAIATISQLAIHAPIPAYDMILTKWAQTRAQQTMPKQPPPIAPPPPPEQLPQNNTTPGIVQQLLDVISVQTRPVQTTPTNAAHSETSPEHINLLSLCGLTDIDQLPPFWHTFRQATTDNGRLQILEKYMAQEKSTDYFISYSLRPDWIKDITKQKFWYPLSNDTLHRGITPFALQKLHTWHEADLFMFEETARQATHVTMEDLNRRNRKGAKPAPTTAQGFLEILANTRAICSILFGHRSPLTIDLETVYRNCRNGQGDHSILTHLSTSQPEWFAHVLWTLTREMQSFFRRSLNPTELASGIKLENPLRRLSQAIETFGYYHQSDTPDCLKPRKPQPTPYTPDKRTPTWDNPETAQKKPRTIDHRHTPTDHHLQHRKAAIEKDISITLSKLLAANNVSINRLLQAAGLPPKTCARHYFWGGCTSPMCSMKHDQHQLNKEQITATGQLLKDCVDKLQPKL